MILVIERRVKRHNDCPSDDMFDSMSEAITAIETIETNHMNHNTNNCSKYWL